MISTEMISIRIPTDLLKKLDLLKEEEGIDRTALIVKSLKYWVAVNGKATTDNEYLARLDKIEKELRIVADKINAETDVRKQLQQQEQVIDVLLKKMMK